MHKIRIGFVLGATLSLLFSVHIEFIVKAAPANCPEISASNIPQLVPLTQLSAQESIVDLRFSSDNQALTVVDAETAQQWELASLQKRTEVKRISSDSPVYAISPDGRWLAEGTAVVNGVLPTPVRLFDMNSGKEVFSSNFTGRPGFFALAKNTVVFFANGDDNSVYTFNWHTGQSKQLFNLKGNFLPDKIVLGISNDLQWLVTFGIDIDHHLTGPLQLWDLNTGHERKDIYEDKGDFAPLPEFVPADFSPDGQYLIIAGKVDTYLFDLKQAKQIAKFKSVGDDISYSTDSQYATISVSYGQQYFDQSPSKISIIELSTGKVLVELTRGNVPVQFSPDSKLLQFSQEKKIHIFDLEKKAERPTLDVAIAPDYLHWIGLFNRDGSAFGYYAPNETHLTWWDVQTGKIVATYDMRLPISPSQDGKLLAATNHSGQIVIWGVRGCAL
jgi:hypothetical protein